MKKRQIAIMVALTSGILLCSGCNLQQTVNDAVDTAGGVASTFNEDDTESKGRDCYEDAKDIIAAQLDTPASAVFPTYGSDGVNVVFNQGEEGGSCYVSGYVDAENLMGATIRAYYGVQINYSGVVGNSTYEYYIDSLY